MKKRILALLLALVMILPLVVACQNTPDDPDATEDTTAPEANPNESTPDDSTEESKEEVPSDYLADLKSEANGKTVTMLYWEDVTMAEFEATDDLSNVINKAIYNRNTAVEDRLGIKLKFAHCKGNDSKKEEYLAKVKSDFDSPTSEYDIYATYSRVSPQLSIKGYTKDLMTLENLDFTKAWWPESLVEECTIGGQLHFCSGDISTNMLWMMIVTFFNKSLLNQYHIEHPYDLVREGKWTTEVLKQYTQDAFQDLDGQEGTSKDDFVGYTLAGVAVDALQTSAGFRAVDHDSDGMLIMDSEFFGEKMTNYMKTIQEWFHTAQGFYYSSGVADPRAIFKDERALFLTDRLFVVAGKDNENASDADKNGITFSFGLVPNPTMSEGQALGTCVGHPFTTYSISKKSSSANIAAATLELLGAESYRYVTPAVYEVTMKLRYAKEEDDAEMYDYIRNSVQFEIGRLMCDTIGTSIASLFKSTVVASSFSTKSFKSSKGTLQDGINTVNAVFAKK